MRSALILFVALAIFVGMSMGLQKLTSSEEEEDHQDQNQAEQKQLPKATLLPGRIATIKTSKGDIRFVLYEKDMPITCNNFVKLVESGFYKSMKFHRVEDIVIQTGDPKGDGTGGSGKTIQLEAKDGLGYNQPYMVGMARTADPNSATSQFFINKQPYIDWNGQYACFGAVIDGQKVVDKIKKGDAFIGVTLAPASASDLKIIEGINKELSSLPMPKPIQVVPTPHEHSHEHSHE
jgi:peptidyl-prolyl cis-trans isomerase B (cyclophilin B)